MKTMIEQPKPSTDLFHREAAVWVNLSAALISATFAAVVAGLVASMVVALEDYVFQIAIGGFLVMFALIWFGLLFRWVSLTNKEKPLAMPAAPAPVNQATVIRVDIATDNGRTHNYMDFNIPVDVIRTLADGLLNNRPFTREGWVSTGVLKEDEFKKIKKEMIERGLMKYKNPNNTKMGVELTPAGRQALEQVRAALPHR
jgi:hypothetical protein